MFRKFFSYYGYRSFSESKILRNSDKLKPKEPENEIASAALKMDFKPSNLDKKILVWSGRYKSVEDIPSRISFETIGNAKSRFRIRASNAIIVATLIMFGVYIWYGKKKRREGDSLLKRGLERNRQILAEAHNN